MNLVTRQETPPNALCTAGQMPSITLCCRPGTPRTAIRVSRHADVGRGPCSPELLDPSPWASTNKTVTTVYLENTVLTRSSL